MLSRFLQRRSAGKRLWQGIAGVLAGSVVSAALLAGDAASTPSFADPLDTAAAQRSQLPTRQYQALARAGERVVAVGQRGMIATSDDGGAHWQQRPSPVQVDLVAVQFVDAQHGWASGHDGVILHSADGGASWTRQFDGRQGPALAAWYATQDGDQELAAEYATQIERNFGQGPWLPILDVHFDDASHGFAMGSFGMLLASADGGASWQPALQQIDNPDYLHLNAMVRSDTATLIASERGTIFRRAGEGRFEPVASGHTGTFFSLASQGNTVLAGGLRGVVYASHDAGASWQAVDSGLAQTVSSIRWLPAQQRFVLVTIGGEVSTADADGTRFSAVPGFAPGIHTSVIDAGNGLVVGGMQGLQVLAGTPKATGEAP